jgi:hypothetical protein
MTMPAPYEGGCACGAVRYRLAGEPLTLYACHCTDCQRHGGASFVLSMIIRKDALHLLRGTPRDYAVEVPGSPSRHGKFCVACATRLWGEPAKFPAVSVLRPGTLDDTTWLEPVAHLWTRSRQRWVRIPEGALVFETQPPDLTALVGAWRERRTR